MSLPPLTSVAELERRLGTAEGSLTGVELARATTALEDASAAVRAEVLDEFVDPDTGELVPDIPDIIVTVTLSAAKRSYLNPMGAADQQAGSFRLQFAEKGLDLTTGERRLLARLYGSNLTSVKVWRQLPVEEETTA